MLTTSKIMGRNIRAMADECCQKVNGCRLSRYNWSIQLDSLQSAKELISCLQDANHYWQSVGKRGKAESAYKAMQFVIEVVAAEGASIPSSVRGRTFFMVAS